MTEISQIELSAQDLRVVARYAAECAQRSWRSSRQVTLAIDVHAQPSTQRGLSLRVLSARRCSESAHWLRMRLGGKRRPVLRRYPTAPASGNRVTELMSARDTVLRSL